MIDEHAAVVQARVDDALRELRELRSTDHAATDAIRAVKLTERTLECWWVPALDAIVAERRSRPAPHDQEM